MTAFLALLLLAAQVNLATEQIEARIAASHADVAIAFRTLDGRSEWCYHADDSFHAASTMKIPVMIELYRQAGATVRVDDHGKQ